ncbi:large tegument protein [Pteropodid alphaherpesvirus 1]|uniref:Large tegument protein n=1 Tax=Pteropodid alphaherpesvirus 1 TaxID=1343901 RepID=A0A060Q4Z4_9ALPH|nr:large tegument protein [Pteropodid alphaherpesvirus 1]BAP00715.1 large tegument protein [Pteropodid alphaherpesvirus 1]
MGWGGMEVGVVSLPKQYPGLSKRRRPTWTPPSSLEDLTSSSHPKRAIPGPPTPASPANARGESASPPVDWGEALETDSPPSTSPTLSTAPSSGTAEQAAIQALQARASPEPPAEDLTQILAVAPGMDALMHNMAAHDATITQEVAVCSQLTINALRSPHTPNLGLLEHCVLFFFERILAFLIENGARTHSNIKTAGPAVALLEHTIQWLPRKTAVGDFLASTHMTLAEVSAHLPLIQQVVDSNSHVGKLALAKLVLIANDIIHKTDDLYGDLAELEQQLRSAPPANLYARLSEWLLERTRTQPDALFAPSTPTHPKPLLQRVQELASFARGEELRAETEDAEMRRALAALAQGVEAVSQHSGPLVVVPQPPMSPAHHPNKTTPLTPTEVGAQLEQVRAAAIKALDNAVREYFHRGAAYSAQALMANTTNDRPYQVASAPVVPLEQLLESLAAFDGHLQEVAQRVQLKPPPPLTTSLSASLLRELVQLGQRLESPEGLAAWLSVLGDAANQGLVERTALNELARNITKINDQLVRRSSGLAELARFNDIDASLKQELESEAAFGAGADAPELIEEGGLSSTVKRLAEDALRHAKSMEATKLTGELSAEAREQLARRTRELEDMLKEARERAARAHKEREAFSQKLQQILRPLPNFAGLKVAPVVLETLKSSLPEGWDSLESAVAASSPEVKAALRADLWGLLGQYREVLEHPTPDTAAALSSLPPCFVAVLDNVFSQVPETPLLRQFFLHHEPAVSRALSEAITASSAAVATASPATTVEAATHAHQVLAKAVAALGPAVLEPAFPLAFLGPLADSAAGYVKATRLALRAREAIGQLSSLGAAAAELVGQMRRVDPQSDGAATLVDEATQAASNTQTQLAACEAEFGGLLHAEGSAGDLSPSGRALQELGKVITAARRRIEELDAAKSELKAKITEHHTRDRSERWASDVNAALDQIESHSEFDVIELRRLAGLAATHNYSLREYRKRAEQALAANGKIVTLALEAAFAFNPFTPENQHHPMLPPLAAIRRITWGPAFSAASEVYADMFKVDVEPLARLLRLGSSLLLLAQAGNGFIDYHEAVTRLAEDLTMVASLRQYVSFFRRGYAEYLDIRDHLEALRAEVHRALGGVPLDLATAVAEAERAQGDLVAAAELVRTGVSLPCPSEDVLADCIQKLERVDQTPVKDTAYAEYVAFATRRDLGEAKDALVRAKQQRAEATEKVTGGLREVLAAQERLSQSEAERLANLKTTLKVVSAPPAAAKALDQARSVAEIVNQIDILADQTEKAPELASDVVEWLSHARQVLAAQPPNPTEPHQTSLSARLQDRLAALAEEHRGVSALSQSLQEAEAEWDEVWGRFGRARGGAWKSAEALEGARAQLRSLQIATGTIASLRANQHYPRISAKHKGVLAAKVAERSEVLEEFGAAVARHDTTLERLRDDVVRRVPWEMGLGALQGLLGELEALVRELPSWGGSQFQHARELIQHRLGLYTAYSQGQIQLGAGITPAPLRSDTLASEKFARDGASGPDVDLQLLRRRGEAFIRTNNTSAPLVLREVTSSLDLPFSTSYLIPSGAPLQYAVCYPVVTDKLGALLMRPEAESVRPSLPDGHLESAPTVAAMYVLTIINKLQLALSDAQTANFQLFERFVRHHQARWRDAMGAAAELYVALAATTLTREFGCHWNELGWQDGLASPQLLSGPLDAQQRSVAFNANDVMVALVAANPEHLYNFWRLDLTQQHEYMHLTLGTAWSSSTMTTLFVQRLTPHSDARVRTLPVFSTQAAHTRGLLFGTREADWRAGKLSATDPLGPWRAHPELTAGPAALLGQLTPAQALVAISVLGRMCLPSHALGALWTCMVPDDYTEYDSCDSFLAARLESRETLPPPPGLGVASPPPPNALYAPSGQQLTVRPSTAARSKAARVTAMDLVLAATLLGAPVVVALRNDTAFSKESELELCLTLFDSREGGLDAELRNSVSSDIESWAARLLHTDMHVIENACLAAQLPQLSLLLASQPLADSPPCLILVDITMTPVRVLWENSDPPGPPVVQFTGGDTLDELPFVSTQEDVLSDLQSAADPFFAQTIIGRPFHSSLLSRDLFPGTPTYKHPTHNPFPFARLSHDATNASGRNAGDGLSLSPALDLSGSPVLEPLPSSDDEISSHMRTWLRGLEEIALDDVGEPGPPLPPSPTHTLGQSVLASQPAGSSRMLENQAAALAPDLS